MLTTSDPSVVKDAAADFGFVAGVDNSAKVAPMIAAINASPSGMVVTFGALFQINYAVYGLIRKPVVFKGSNGGGLIIAPGQTASGNMLMFGGVCNQEVRDFTLDLNGATPAGNATPLYFGNAGVARVRNSTVKGLAAPPTAADSALLVAMYGVPQCEVIGCSLQLNAPSAFANQAVNIGTAAYPCGRVTVEGVYTKNTGVAVVIASGPMRIVQNEIDGFGYGAGLSLGTAYDAAPKFADVSENFIHDGLGIDHNGYNVSGIETWWQGAKIHGNTLRRFGGCAIVLGARADVTGNTMEDVWQNTPGGPTSSAIFAEMSLNSTPDGSFVDGNSYRGMTGSYGYAETVGLQNFMGMNHFVGSVAPYSLRGSVKQVQ